MQMCFIPKLPNYVEHSHFC